MRAASCALAFSLHLNALSSGSRTQFSSVRPLGRYIVIAAVVVVVLLVRAYSVCGLFVVVSPSLECLKSALWLLLCLRSCRRATRVVVTACLAVVCAAAAAALKLSSPSVRARAFVSLCLGVCVRCSLERASDVRVHECAHRLGNDQRQRFTHTTHTNTLTHDLAPLCRQHYTIVYIRYIHTHLIPYI